MFSKVDKFVFIFLFFVDNLILYNTGSPRYRLPDSRGRRRFVHDGESVASSSSAFSEESLGFDEGTWMHPTQLDLDYEEYNSEPEQEWNYNRGDEYYQENDEDFQHYHDEDYDHKEIDDQLGYMPIGADPQDGMVSFTKLR